MTDYYIEPIGSDANTRIGEFLKQHVYECESMDTICLDGRAPHLYKVDRQVMVHALSEPDLRARFFKRTDDGVAPFSERDFEDFISEAAFSGSEPRRALLQHMRSVRLMDDMSNAQLALMRDTADSILQVRKLKADIGSAAERKPMQRAARRQPQHAAK